MNRVSSNCLNRVVSHAISKQRPPAPRISQARLAGLPAVRAKSHKASPNAEKRENDQDGHVRSETNVEQPNARDERVDTAKKDAPLPYQNTTSEWADTSSLSPYLRKYPSLYKGVKLLYDGLGMYAKHGDAVRLGKKVYMGCCERDIIEENMVYDTCHIPRTFHSWFQITNLHVWLLTVRIRALPPPHGRLMLQALVDFFFADIEDRLRSLLGKKISERTITGYMKEYKELWNGSQMSLDIGIVGGDWELAGAVWRNLFDAKGWDLGGRRGDDGQILSSLPPTPQPSEATSQALGLNAETSVGTAREQAELPHHIYTLTAYLRRELKRLEEIPDEAIIYEGDVGEWGRMDGLGSGDEVLGTEITEKELLEWSKRAEQMGVYR